MRSGDIGAIEAYIRSGGDVNALQRGNETLLMIAAEADQHESASLLIDNGADVRASDNRGRTALMYAASAGSDPIVDLADMFTEGDAREEVRAPQIHQECP